MNIIVSSSFLSDYLRLDNSAHAVVRRTGRFPIVDRCCRRCAIRILGAKAGRHRITGTGWRAFSDHHGSYEKSNGNYQGAYNQSAHGESEDAVDRVENDDDDNGSDLEVDGANWLEEQGFERLG